MKNTFKLKAILRLAGIIVIVAVIAFSMTACSDDGGSTYTPITQIPDNYLNTVWAAKGALKRTISFTESTSTFLYKEESEETVYTNAIYPVFEYPYKVPTGWDSALYAGRYLILFKNDGSRLRFTSKNVDYVKQ